MRWKQNFATNMAYLGRALIATGQREEGAPLYEKELAIETELAGLVGLRVIRDAIPRLQKSDATAPLGRALFYEAEILRKTEPQAADALDRRAESELAPVVAKSSDPSDLALWTRILIRRGLQAEGKAMLVRMRRTGQWVGELEPMCAESGC